MDYFKEWGQLKQRKGNYTLLEITTIILKILIIHLHIRIMKIRMSRLAINLHVRKSLKNANITFSLSRQICALNGITNGKIRWDMRLVRKYHAFWTNRKTYRIYHKLETRKKGKKQNVRQEKTTILNNRKPIQQNLALQRTPKSKVSKENYPSNKFHRRRR